jgi:hypothetical protein
MRDPARIDRVLSQLRDLWVQVPDWRLGQIIVNAVKPRSPCPEIFSVEDCRLEELLGQLTDQLPRGKSE